MIYASVCSGIEAASVAWLPLGWRCAWTAEIDPFPCAVLKHHYPETPNRGDFTKIQASEPIDLLVGGTPCQSFSVAGLRAGLADPRGNLALEFLALAGRLRPKWVVWENVPGVLSVDGGACFAAFLRGLQILGYLGCYRILDAQYFGLAQRRKRVFVVAYLGDWRPPAAVLLERASLSGHPAPSREAGEVLAPPLGDCSNGGGANGPGRSVDSVESLIPVVSPALKSRDYKGPSSDGDGDGAPLIVHSLRAEGFDASEDGTLARSLRGRSNATHREDSNTYIPVAGAVSSKWAKGTGGPAGDECYNLTAHSLRAEGFDASEDGTGRGTPLVARATSVRRLVPEECESLQGFPCGYTLIPYRGKPACDGPRYKALGNSMAVPVMRWIGARIGNWPRTW